jgi:hypothetical protein
MVRKIFGQANIPGKPQTVGEQTTQDKSVDDDIKANGDGRLYGVHVVNMNSFRQAYGQECHGLDVSMSYLVSIVSVSSLAPETDVRNTHNVIQLDHESALQPEIAGCLMEHAESDSVTNSMRKGVARVAIYLSGVATTSNEDNQSLATAVQKVLPHLVEAKLLKSKGKAVRLTVMAPQTKLGLEEAESLLDIVTTMPDTSENAIGQYTLGDEQNNADLAGKFGLHQSTLRRIYRRPDGFRNSDGSLRDTSAVIHVVNKYFDSGATSEYLERRHLPDILHLAQAASKRGKSYVYLKSDNERHVRKWSYDIAPVHEVLRNSLYYI